PPALLDRGLDVTLAGDGHTAQPPEHRDPDGVPHVLVGGVKRIGVFGLGLPAWLGGRCLGPGCARSETNQDRHRGEPTYHHETSVCGIDHAERTMLCENCPRSFSRDYVGSSVESRSASEARAPDDDVVVPGIREVARLSVWCARDASASPLVSSAPEKGEH